MQIKASKAQLATVLRHALGSCLYEASTVGDTTLVSKILVPSSCDWLVVVPSESLTEEEFLDRGSDGVQGPDHDPHKPLDEQGWKEKPRLKMDPGAIRVVAIE